MDHNIKMMTMTIQVGWTTMQGKDRNKKKTTSKTRNTREPSMTKSCSNSEYLIDNEVIEKCKNEKKSTKADHVYLLRHRRGRE